MNPFVSASEIRTYLVKGHAIRLALEPGVFCPSEHGSKLTDYIALQQGETVLDMGTGTGFLGIVAAKQGGIVDVSDPSERAVNLALHNAELNRVGVAGYVGEYFCTPRKTYDYIIANLPHEIIPEPYIREIGSLEKTINGGLNGNEYILTFLDQARFHMHRDSRILVCAYSMSDYIATLQKMKSMYLPKLLDVFTYPAKDFVQTYISTYDPLIRDGTVGVFRKEGLWQSTVFVYELRKK